MQEKAPQGACKSVTYGMNFALLMRVWPILAASARKRGEKWESAGKPGSVVGNHSSGMHVAVHLKQPTRKHARAARCSTRLRASLFGLAPGGVCRAVDVTADAVRSYRTLSPLPSCENARLGGLLSVALSVGSRPPGVTWRLALWSPDFPPFSTGKQRLPGRLPQAR